MPDGRVVVGITPHRAFKARRRLFAALEAAHPVRFEPRARGRWEGLEAVVGFGAGSVGRGVVTCPTLTLHETEGEGRATVLLSENPALDGILRGKRLLDDCAEAAAGAPIADGQVLAHVGRSPVWIASGDSLTFAAAIAPGELAAESALRELVRPGRWLGLLPLLQFLRLVSSRAAWTAPPLRASLMIDDPNLHWRSYGRLRFHELTGHASHHGYHLAFAMVPLDGRFVHPPTGRLFRERRDAFSLVMHGNDHTRLELYRDMPTADRVALVAQALRRTATFERRHGIHVDRVMTSPHGLASADSMTAMFRLGVEAFTGDWPFPWVPPDALSGGWPLAGYEPAQLLASAFPVLLRSLFEEPLDDLVLRAFLNQPLIVYGHHDADLDRLAAVARVVNGLGDVHWSPLESIARSNYLTRLEGRTLFVRAYARRLSVEIPADAEQLVVELPPASGAADVLELDVDGGKVVRIATRADGYRVSPPIALDGAGRVELRISSTNMLDPQVVPRPSRTPWPVVRRMLTEGRDRLLRVALVDA